MKCGHLQFHILNLAFAVFQYNTQLEKSCIMAYRNKCYMYKGEINPVSILEKSTSEM